MRLNARDILKKITPHFIWCQGRLIKLKLHILFFKKRVECHRYGDFNLQVCISDGLSAGWYGGDWLEMPDINMLKMYGLRSGAKVMNIGAHQGIVAMVMAKHVGPTGNVLAIEANHHNRLTCEVNRKLNNLKNLQILEAAVGEKSGFLMFNEGLDGSVDDGSEEWGKKRVRAVTIDELGKEYFKPDVLYIDVEGYEWHVLQGALEIEKTKPDWFVEVHTGCGLEKFESNIAQIWNYFNNRGYRVFCCSQELDCYKEIFHMNELPTHRFFLIAVHPTKHQAIF